MTGAEPTKWAGLKKHSLSARDFKDPLLLALGRATGFKPDRPVDCEGLYDPICKLLGITRDQFGNPEKSSTSWVERWVQDANKSLIAAGLTCRAERGEWCLTPKGVSTAQPLQTKQELQDIQVLPTEEESPREVVTGTTGRYSDDPYIRALAIQETSCYGLYSSVSETCTSCPLQAHCLGAMSAELSRLQLDLAREEHK